MVGMGKLIKQRNERGIAMCTVKVWRMSRMDTTVGYHYNSAIDRRRTDLCYEDGSLCGHVLSRLS